MQRVFNEYLSMLEAYLKEAMDGGEIRRVDPGRLAAVILEIVNGVLLHHIHQSKKFDPEKETAFILAVIFKGIEKK
jgi:hypothetical protein